MKDEPFYQQIEKSMSRIEKISLIFLIVTITIFFFHLNRASRLDRRTDRTTMLLVAVLLLFLITEFPQGILGLLSGIMGNW